MHHHSTNADGLAARETRIAASRNNERPSPCRCQRVSIANRPSKTTGTGSGILRLNRPGMVEHMTEDDESA
jgi:hypothetical protein